MKIIDNIPVWGPAQSNAVAQMANAMKFGPVAGAALMADHHLGYSVPVGGVIAYKDAISPSAVGFDIACGNMAILTDVTTADLSERQIKILMDDIMKVISFGVGRVNNEPVDAATLLARLTTLKATNPNAAVVIRPDRNLPVQKLITLMDLMQQAQITRVGIATRAETP